MRRVLLGGYSDPHGGGGGGGGYDDHHSGYGKEAAKDDGGYGGGGEEDMTWHGRFNYEKRVTFPCDFHFLSPVQRGNKGLYVVA